MSMSDQVVAVTGSGRGLGRAYALEAARRGASVVVNDVGVDENGARRADLVAAEIEEAGGKAIVSGADIATPDGGRELIAAAIDTFGRIDAVINNAGFIRPSDVVDLTDKQLDEIVDVHVKAAFYTTRAAWPHFAKQGYGRLVFTSSGSSFGHSGNSHYSAAKGGMIGLARSLAEEGRDFDLKANCILPYAKGVITIENPLKGNTMPETRRLLDSMESRRDVNTVAPMVLYLASRECAVNGEAFSALAGRYARVAYGLTSGWIAKDPDHVSVEDIGAHIGEITDPSEIFIPATMQDEIRQTSDRLIALGYL